MKRFFCLKFKISITTIPFKGSYTQVLGLFKAMLYLDLSLGMVLGFFPYNREPLEAHPLVNYISMQVYIKGNLKHYRNIYYWIFKKVPYVIKADSYYFILELSHTHLFFLFFVTLNLFLVWVIFKQNRRNIPIILLFKLCKKNHKKFLN